MTEGEHAVLRHTQTIFESGTIGELTDRELLERFAGRDRELAELCFAALLKEPKQGAASALSHFEFRVNRLQFQKGIIDVKLTVDAPLPSVAVIAPRCGFVADFVDRSDATTSNALPGR
jgi:hypothetical protein